LSIGGGAQDERQQDTGQFQRKISRSHLSWLRFVLLEEMRAQKDRRSIYLKIATNTTRTDSLERRAGPMKSVPPRGRIDIPTLNRVVMTSVP
jgi:hypothetical protein